MTMLGSRSLGVVSLLCCVTGLTTSRPSASRPTRRRAELVRRAEVTAEVLGRRAALSLGVTALATTTLSASAVEDEGAWWGSEGILSWVSSDKYASVKGEPRNFPIEFTTYLSRFLLNFDTSCEVWWRSRLATIPAAYTTVQRRELESKYFAEFAKSVEYGLRWKYPGATGPDELLRSLEGQHGFDTERRRHLALAFSFLGADQPRDGIKRLLKGVDERTGRGGSVETVLPPMFSPALPDYMARDMRTLLPSTQRPVLNDAGLYEVRGLQFGPVKAMFGGVATEAFVRERPLTSVDFGLFAVAGAAGCAATHSVVVPIDVVKTRLQTSPGRYTGLVEGIGTMYREEGWRSLFTGASPTLIGYLWYGLTVYPGYELLGRTAVAVLGEARAAEYHAPVVLLAGAMATVVACIGLCPAEICRIRMVANPELHPTLPATVRTVLDEGGGDPASFYRGFRPLLARQVIFGMVKFFFFDSCASAILDSAPQLRETVASRLLVSLLAGLLAGTASSLISQPADTVLSTMNKASKEGETDGIIATAQSIYTEFGFSGFYLGAFARCLWSGTVISGQFFFYDLARSAFSVSSGDLRFLLDVNL